MSHLREHACRVRHSRDRLRRLKRTTQTDRFAQAAFGGREAAEAFYFR